MTVDLPSNSNPVGESSSDPPAVAAFEGVAAVEATTWDQTENQTKNCVTGELPPPRRISELMNGANLVGILESLLTPRNSNYVVRRCT